ncbi:MAG: hypothetical protein K6G24_11550 [Lachnospiraceae bacterium]|nr:hypothetical protein [Lachnospiraceae bacterium]
MDFIEKNTAPSKKVKGSITVEAAFAFPLFFFACMALCYLFVFIKTEYVIQREMYYAARELSGYGPVIEPVIDLRNRLLTDTENGILGEDSDEKGLADVIGALTDLIPGNNGLSIKNIISNAGDALVLGAVMSHRLTDDEVWLVDGGKSGISCYGSELFDREKCLNLVLSYDLRLPLALFPDISVPVTHTIRYRYYTGTEVKSLLFEVKQDDGEEESEEEKEEEVLITDTGHCYHYSYSCPALNVRPKKIAFDTVGQKRNDGGAKYYPCEICARNKTKCADCYITPDGDRYHFDKSCPGLKRTIESVPISKVGKRRECKRCRNLKEKQ